MVDINMVTMCLNPLLEDENCREETLVNMYQALSLQGKRINSLTIEMEQVKLDQKAVPQEKGTYIQGQNIQINQGKMLMPEKCHTTTAHSDALVRPPLSAQTSTTCEEALIRPLQGCDTPPTYKEALVRPPPMNMSQQLDTANKTDQAILQNPSRNQFESHNRRFEPNRIPRNRFVHNPSASQVPNRREQFYARNYNQQFEDPRRARTYKPPIAEQGRWVTIGSPNLKPIHQKVYKYGYNPNFHKMTKTQRRRWIKNQASKQKEMQQGGSSSQVGSGQNNNVIPSTQEDMDCEETMPVKEDKNIYIGRYIPTQSAKDSYQP
uniref:Uncharacterized protein n=1 Tax=Fagus sylvatica TaxID=28930 RepID=A0A2N9IQV8_FAGSY